MTELPLVLGGVESAPRNRVGLRRKQFMAAIVVALAFAAPALWNGFPLIFFDTGGYLSAALQGEASDGRAAIYGALLALGLPLAFWPIVALQAALMSWLLVLLLRAHGLGQSPSLTLLLGLALAAFTSLPWYAAQLMPDVFSPAAVIALYLLAFHPARFSRLTRIMLAGVIAVAVASHMATLGLAVGLCACLGLCRIVAARLRRPRPHAALPAVATAAGLLLALGSNSLLIDRFGFTPGGSNFLFGRLVQSGIAEQYLADRCPDATLRLCAYRSQLPDNGDDWLWADDTSPLYKLGGWDAFAEEASRILHDSLVDYPLDHALAALTGTLAQLVMVKSGDGLTSWAWNAQWVIGSISPALHARLQAARQQEAAIDLTWLNLLHVPLALLATAGLPIVILLGRRRVVAPRTVALAAFVLLALLGNAFICGALSNPHHRYQSRLVPLAPLAIGLAALATRRRNQTRLMAPAPKTA